MNIFFFKTLILARESHHHLQVPITWPSQNIRLFGNPLCMILTSTQMDFVTPMTLLRNPILIWWIEYTSWHRGLRCLLSPTFLLTKYSFIKKDNSGPASIWSPLVNLTMLPYVWMNWSYFFLQRRSIPSAKLTILAIWMRITVSLIAFINMRLKSQTAASTSLVKIRIIMIFVQNMGYILCLIIYICVMRCSIFLCNM